MMINNYLSRSEQKLLEGSLLEAAEKARALLAPISLGIFVRKSITRAHLSWDFCQKTPFGRRLPGGVGFGSDFYLGKARGDA